MLAISKEVFLSLAADPSHFVGHDFHSLYAGGGGPGVGGVGGQDARHPIHGLRRPRGLVASGVFRPPGGAPDAAASQRRQCLDGADGGGGNQGRAHRGAAAGGAQGAHAGALAGLAGWFCDDDQGRLGGFVADVGKAPRSTTGLTLEQLVTYGC